jgi:hypothetical protein
MGRIVTGDRYVLLHVGKTGGSYTQHLISRVPGAATAILCLPHRCSFAMALIKWPGRPVVFGIRAPDRIFVSGFYSRMREGRPRYHVPWSPGEREAFRAFTTPNQLAEALSAPCARTRHAAETAMTHIGHVKNGLRAYLHSASFVSANAASIAFILRQDHLDADLPQFLSRFGSFPFDPPCGDPVVRHSNPSHLDTRLSDVAAENVARWYAPDFEIYRTCLAIAAGRRHASRVCPARLSDALEGGGHDGDVHHAAAGDAAGGTTRP